MSDTTSRKIVLPKPSADEIIGDITAFVASKPLEERFQERLTQRKKLIELLKELGKDGDIKEDALVRFLSTDDEAIIAVISILGMSQEEFHRIVTLIRVLDRSFESEWKMDKIITEVRKGGIFAKRLADLLLNGKNDKELAKHVPEFTLDKLDKSKLLLNLDALVDSLIKTGLKGAYDEAKGDVVEDQIKAILDKLNVPYKRTVSVPNLDRNMDFVIPNVEDPRILIEVGIFVTTARELSEKGLVEKRIRQQTEEHYPDAVLVRVVDGIGWLARGGKALPSIIDASHYVLTINQIDKLRDIVEAHVPKKYFKTTLQEFQSGGATAGQNKA